MSYETGDNLMGVDDNTPTVHENIQSGSLEPTTGYATVTLPNLRMHDLYFTGGSPNEHKTFLTLTEEGKLVIGDGLSMDEATQSAAKMLAKYYGFEITKKITELQEALNKRNEP